MSSLQMNINVVRGSDAMVSKGMLARVSVQLVTPDGSVMLQLDDMLIRDGKDGPWVSPPARQSEGKDGKTTWYKYYRFYPDNEDMRKKIEKRILDQYNATPIPSGSNQNRNQAPKAPASKQNSYSTGSRNTPATAPAATTNDSGMNLDDFNFEIG